MSGLPVVLDVEGRLCVVIGGGRAGSLKAQALVAAGADLRVIDPGPLDPAPLDHARIDHRRRRWRAGDGDGAFLVVIATDDEAVNEAAAADAERQGALVLRADLPERGSVRFPAVLRAGRVTVAIDTDGASPTLAAWLRDRIADRSQGWAELADWATANRPVTTEQLARHHENMTGENLADKNLAGERAGAES